MKDKDKTKQNVQSMYTMIRRLENDVATDLLQEATWIMTKTGESRITGQRVGITT